MTSGNMSFGQMNAALQEVREQNANGSSAHRFRNGGGSILLLN